MFEVKFRRLDSKAVIPQYAHGPREDAGMDLVAIEPMVLEAFDPTLVKTGLSIELPAGIEAQIRPRSGLALKYGVTVYNSPGTIDPGYRGELGAILWWSPTMRQLKNWAALTTDQRLRYKINAGDRIAQIVFAQYAMVQPVLTEELAGSARGIGGFGSTGA
jgi:dUTP pyrophosphatase